MKEVDDMENGLHFLKKDKAIQKESTYEHIYHLLHNLCSAPRTGATVFPHCRQVQYCG